MGLTALTCSAALLSAVAACGAEGGGDVEETITPRESTSAEESPDIEVPSDDEESDMAEETPFIDPSWGIDDPKSGAELTITGTVESGVESGCLVMTYNGEVYGIFGDFDKSVVYAGASVTLHGRLEPDMMSFCMQGTPFVVERAESAD